MNGIVLSGYSVGVENRVHRSHGRDGPRSLIVCADGALKTVPFLSGIKFSVEPWWRVEPEHRPNG